MEEFVVKKREEFGLAQGRGFLPKSDPLLRLSLQYEAWETLVAKLPTLLLADRVGEAVESLPQLSTAELLEDELDRAMMVLSYIAHAYVYETSPPRASIPAQVAVPWCAVADKLDRPPILAYASHSLSNWRRLDDSREVGLDNVARLVQFYGGMDEDWFVLVHVVIEQTAAPCVDAVLELQYAMDVGDADAVEAALVTIGEYLGKACEVLARMPTKCDPHIFFLRGRRFIFGWYNNPALPDGVVYEGAREKPVTDLRGETGAQSSLIPCLDLALGIHFEDDHLKHHVLTMREYAPREHRNFLDFLEKSRNVRQYLLDSPDLRARLAPPYNKCVELVGRFRRMHLEFAKLFIFERKHMEGTSGTHPHNVGTGGTPFLKYLSDHIGAVLDHKLPVS
eukprot:CAMPEP_0119132438 /NCGR_PEP_ID=MMETSP1310-20130426/11837_1 /TAXON_ID=464262 /ORGANISM="Genus nov. species nov., Strain RCC2339" /LENGTH=393 /DNA_ID=CAMNT_0007123073 /DNA_START=16 /DNA_END=1197 /DNA_ORIENTATION=+